MSMLLHDLKCFLCSSCITGQDKLGNPSHLLQLHRNANRVRSPCFAQRPIVISEKAGGGGALGVAEEDEAAAGDRSSGDRGGLAGDLRVGGGDDREGTDGWDWFWREEEGGAGGGGGGAAAAAAA